MSQDPLPARETLVCAATVTPREDSERNEDAFMPVCAPRAGVYGVAVADGLGSYSRAGRAARYAAREAAAWLRDETEHFGRGTLTRLFAQVHTGLRSHARDAAGGGDPEAQAFGTTLLVGLDAGAELVAAYAGNGAIWHIRGNLDGFASAAGLPWNAVNLLNPHSVPRDGREVLYNILDAAEATPPLPTEVSVRKDPRFGDILVLCTDGIYSADQLTHGTDASGGAWVSAEATMVAFHQALRELFAGWDGEGEPPLEATLRAYLGALRSRGMLEDDATVGVIVTADALRYQRSLAAARAALAAAGAASGSTPARSGDPPAAYERDGVPAGPAWREAGEPVDAAEAVDSVGAGGNAAAAATAAAGEEGAGCTPSPASPV
ncbi:MAG: protein phosphatase 2C domain-containing protein [Longimicrobiaceae bacterium]